MIDTIKSRLIFLRTILRIQTSPQRSLYLDFQGLGLRCPQIQGVYSTGLGNYTHFWRIQLTKWHKRAHFAILLCLRGLFKNYMLDRIYMMVCDIPTSRLLDCKSFKFRGMAILNSLLINIPFFITYMLLSFRIYS